MSIMSSARHRGRRHMQITSPVRHQPGDLSSSAIGDLYDSICKEGCMSRRAMQGAAVLCVFAKCCYYYSSCWCSFLAHNVVSM